MRHAAANEALSHRELLMVRSRIKQTAIQTKANKLANRQTTTATTARTYNNKQQQTNNKQQFTLTHPKLKLMTCVREEGKAVRVCSGTSA